MNVLLLSMPDSFEHMPELVIRMPNGALTSLAGNIDPHHKVSVADLILAQRHVRETVERLVRETEPDVVGLSVMTFQRRTAMRIIELIRSLRPATRIVVGGYDRASRRTPTRAMRISNSLYEEKARSRFVSCCGPSKTTPVMLAFQASATELARDFNKTPTVR